MNHSQDAEPDIIGALARGLVYPHWGLMGQAEKDLLVKYASKFLATITPLLLTPLQTELAAAKVTIARLAPAELLDSYQAQGADLAVASAKLVIVVGALAWYEKQASLCRLIHSGGDQGRAFLAADGGLIAHEALTKIGEQK